MIGSTPAANITADASHQAVRRDSGASWRLRNNTSAFSGIQGFYRSGDLMRAHRYAGTLCYSIEGRVKDLIDRRGEKINAEEVELLLAHHPAVAEMALAGMPDPRLGEHGCAYIVPRDRQNPQTLAGLCAYLEAEGLTKYKWRELCAIRTKVKGQREPRAGASAAPTRADCRMRPRWPVRLAGRSALLPAGRPRLCLR